jgi:hypothetical protein
VTDLATMYLLNVSSLRLELFQGEDVPLYAILSHTWAEDEVTFEEINSYDQSKPEDGHQKQGMMKIRKTCELAIEHGLKYVWIDVSLSCLAYCELGGRTGDNTMAYPLSRPLTDKTDLLHRQEKQCRAF